MTNATYLGRVELPECDRPLDKYALTPGTAYVLDPKGETSTREFTKAECERAEYTYCLRWIGGRTVAAFTLDGLDVCQPLNDPDDQRSKKEPRAKPSPGVTYPTDEAPKPAQKPRLPRKGPKVPKPKVSDFEDL